MTLCNRHQRQPDAVEGLLWRCPPCSSKLFVKHVTRNANESFRRLGRVLLASTVMEELIESIACSVG